MSRPDKEYYRYHYDQGRSKRLEAQLNAYKTRSAVVLPEHTYHATCAKYWREGWNSVSLEDIKEYISQRCGRGTPKKNQIEHLNHARQAIGASS